MPRDSIHKSELKNGVTILVDSDMRFASVAFAVCLYGGLRGETIETVGLTHFCEHLLLKRTTEKSPKDVAIYIDRLGGEINAFTDADSLCLHGVVPASEAEGLMDFLAELLCKPAFDKKDVETEREIIRQEILDSSDDPTDVVYREFSKSFWPDSVLGSPTFGTLELLESFSFGDLYERLQSLLVGKKILVVASGAITEETVVAHAEKSYSHLESGRRIPFETPTNDTGICLVQKPFTQLYFSLGTDWPAMKDKDFLVGVLVASILGEGMSSRLFQAIREDHGLVYDVGAEIDMYADTSCLAISGAVEASNIALALDLISGELTQLKKQGVTEEEISRVIDLHRSQLAMESDSLTTRLWRCLESEVVFGRHISRSELSEKFSAIGCDDVQRFLEKRLGDKQFLLTIAGEVESIDVSDEVIRLCGEKITRIE